MSSDNSKRSNEKWQLLKPLAREMRHEPTLAERLLWQRLRGHHMDGIQFRRQHAIRGFIVDFYCAAAHLVIEVDGSIHDDQCGYDAERQAILEGLGLRVLRFRNEHVLQEIDGVLDVIYEIVDESHGKPLS